MIPTDTKLDAVNAYYDTCFPDIVADLMELDYDQDESEAMARAVVNLWKFRAKEVYVN